MSSLSSFLDPVPAFNVIWQNPKSFKAVIVAGMLPDVPFDDEVEIDCCHIRCCCCYRGLNRIGKQVLLLLASGERSINCGVIFAPFKGAAATLIRIDLKVVENEAD